MGDRDEKGAKGEREEKGNVGERGAGIFTSISIFLTFCVSSLILFDVAFN